MSANPYESPENAHKSNWQGPTQLRKLLIPIAWCIGAILPAATINVAAFVDDQSKYGESEASRELFANLNATMTTVFLASVVLSIALMCGATWQTQRSIAWKVSISLLSLLVASILFCGGLLTTFAITGVPVD
jgi:hypothetical protein